jgi:hypothetical protein
MYFTHWINLYLHGDDPIAFRINETHARWIFVLLSRVEDQISADDTSLLRGMARACLELLKGIIKKKPVLSEEVDSHTLECSGGEITERSCWMIVSIIVGIWGQRDLWMEAEAMLRALDCLAAAD